MVERTVDDTFVGIATDSGEGQCPAVLVEACGIHGHAAEHVVGVGIGYRTIEAGSVM